MNASDRLERIIEAILLAAREPLSLEQILAVFDTYERPERYQVQQAIQRLQQATSLTSQELKQVAGGYRYQIKADYAPWVSRLWETKPPRYSRALLETLACIAYRQPVTRSDIEAVRGVSVSSQIIHSLEERGWIKVIGYREGLGRPALYATTRHFLDYFNLKSLTELPPLDELRALAEHEALEWQDELDILPHRQAKPNEVSNKTKLTFADLLEKLADPSVE